MRTHDLSCLRSLLGAAIIAGCALHASPLGAADLPVPCLAGACGPSVPTFVSEGAANLTQSGTRMDVTQTTDRATLNWQSFDIAAGRSVNFAQPSSGSIALNRIHQGDPSRILGALNANGQVYLLNRNGIVFGSGAQVNVGGLVASSLDISAQAVELGIARAAERRAPAFQEYQGDAGQPLASGAVSVERGASIQAVGGQVLVFAPNVANEGTIRTPDGQTILAAGRSVFLTTSADPNLRGLLVEVGVGGNVTNGSALNAGVQRPEDIVGQIIAERGNVTLAGLAVNQQGRITATTTVRQNGSIVLRARDGASAIPAAEGQPSQLVTTNGGRLTLGPRSTTRVDLETGSTEQTVDANLQPQSAISLEGRVVNILDQASVVANGGRIGITARANPQLAPDLFSSTPDDSRVYLARGARLDVSGAVASVPVERNVLRVELRGNQLRDSPVQRDGPLRGEAVFVDIRQSGVRADGSRWIGTPLADVSGDISTLQRGVAERNAAGGLIDLAAQGDVILAPGSVVDLSGGRIDYRAGYLNTTQLRGADGRLYDIANANRDRVYVGIAGGSGRGRFDPGYSEGRDAGQLTIISPRAVLEADLQGRVTRGPLQRQPTNLALEPGALRPFNEVPRGAQLTLGNAAASTRAGANFVLNEARWDGGIEFAALRGGGGGAFDPLSDALPSEFVTRLRSAWFGSDRLAELAVLANGAVRQPRTVSLRLPVGGRLAVTAGVIEIGGDVDAPAGQISLVARETTAVPAGSAAVLLRSGARLSARGAWVNDSELFAGSAPLFTRGGTVSIAALQGDVELEEGSAIDVSGGAWRQRDGRIQAGRGGSISLQSSPSGPAASPSRLRIGASLEGYGIAQGGSLAITANSICIASSDCAGADRSVLALTPERFSSGGFEDFRIASNRGGIRVENDTLIRVQQSNLQFVGDVSRRPSSTGGIREFSRVTLLPDASRRAANLSLTARIAAGDIDFTADRFLSAPEMSIGARAIVQTDVRGSLSLTSNSRVVVDGTLSAPAGSIALVLDDSLATGEFLPSQAIWLTGRSRLDARGVPLLQTTDRGLRAGDVLGGGSVSINAQRGYVLAAPGSVIDVSGTQAVLDLAARDSGSAVVRPAEIASAGGKVVLRAAEGIQLGSTLVAAAGRPGEGQRQPAGGSLAVRLDGNARNDPAVALGAAASFFPTGPRRIEVGNAASAAVVAPGAAVPNALNGAARIDASAVEAAGFASVTLTAATLETLAQRNTVLVPGVLRFLGDATLATAARIQLEAALFESGGGLSRVAAPFVTLGDPDARRQQNLLPASGNGSLQVQARHIDLVGSFAIGGVRSVELTSSGDLRVRGLQAPNSSELVGALVTSGDLLLRARQVYPTTLSRFSFSSTAPTASRIRLESSPGPRAPVLSAGGTLSLTAARIEQGGTLLAPRGTISLTAPDLALLGGSTTSVSLGGRTVPFGSTQGGFDWVYELEGLNLVFEPGRSALPSASVILQGERIDVRSGATIDLSGGGDLLAYEFVPGTGGSVDVLSASARPDQFAILPGSAFEIAPFDPRESRGTSLQAGDSIYLAGGIDGLPAGAYTLLPARYGLLPGAFLVRPVAGFRDLLPGDSFSQLDGATVVAGYRGIAGTPFADARWSGFAVRPAELARREAQYQTTGANAFFAAQALQRAGTSPPRLPRDAGVLSVLAGAGLELNGILQASPGAAAGRGAVVEIGAERIRVTREATPAAGGEVILLADQLERLRPQTLSLGATATAGAESATRLNVLARNVSLDSGVTLTAPEILLAASDRVEVRSGATLAPQAGAAAGGIYEVRGDGALLRASSGSQATLVRTGTSAAAGVLNVAGNAVVRAPGGSALLDASAETQVAGALEIAGGSLAFAANRISLGGAPAGTPGLQLDAAALRGIGLRELKFASRSTIDLYGPVVLAAADLTLDAAGLRGFATSGISVVEAAERLRIRNLSGTALPEPATGSAPASGTLVVRANAVELDRGAFAIQGYEQTSVQSATSVRASASGALNAAGSMEVRSARVSGASGVDYVFSAERSLQVVGNGAGTSRSADLGASLTFAASEISIDGPVSAPAGRITLLASGPAANGGVALGQRALVDVAGAVREFDGLQLQAPAGSVRIGTVNGAVTAAPGARIELAAAGDSGVAGDLTVLAPTGRIDFRAALAGGATRPGDSARVRMEAFEFVDFAGLQSTLNAGGAFGSRMFRQLGAGELVVGPGAALRSTDIGLFADAGALRIEGDLDLMGAARGRVVLGARDEVAISGRILAASRQPGGDGGRVQLWSGGAITFGSGSSIDVSPGAGGRGGSVLVRAPRTRFLGLLDADPTNDSIAWRGSVQGARDLVFEGFAVYSLGAPTIATAQVNPVAANPWFAEAGQFATRAPALLAALGFGSDPVVRIVPGIELRSMGRLALAADWNLFNWRFAGQPGVLTIRSGGDLVFDRSLSDGFATPTTFLLPAVADPSWSYRLVAGADSGSADLMATQRDLINAGDFIVSNGIVASGPTGTSTFRAIRTGSGDIDIAAARDFRLGNQASVIYTAGVSGPGIRFGTRPGTLQGRAYPINGGDIRISAGRDVLGAPSNQFVTDWLWRVGGSLDSAVAWTVNFQRFEQNVGALAGGNIAVVAGRDVRSLGASISSIGRQVGGTTFRDSQLQIVGGGDLSVRAGGSILDGAYFVGLGSGALRAGDRIGATSATGSTAPLIGIGDSSWVLTSRRDLTLGAVTNPTLLPQARSQAVLSANASYFSTYGPRSSLFVSASSGDLRLDADTQPLADRLTSMTFGNTGAFALRVLPPVVRLAALDGSVVLDGTTSLFPSPQGDLAILAWRDIRRSERDATTLVILSDADPAYLPSLAAPQTSIDRIVETMLTPDTTSRNFNAPVPVYAPTRRGALPLEPVRIVARFGDIDLLTRGIGDSSAFYLAKPGRFIAGRDIVDLGVTVQHVGDADYSVIRAERDIRFSNQRLQSGQIVPSFRELRVDGPGDLLLQAGSGIDLQTSGGVISRGNVRNPALPAGGAGLTLLAGVQPAAARYTEFIDAYLARSAVYDAALVDYVARRTGSRPADASQALARFRLLEQDAQRPLLEQILFAELRAAGRFAATSPNADYGRGFRALTTLFPGSNPDLARGERNAFGGDIRLFFSRVYTLGGGSISLLAPGGEVNVGLATPPAAFGIAKAPSELGVVVQRSGNVNALSFRDFQVNESRVFAADGGDILVWSTAGDIDAGRGAKTAISAPPPRITIDPATGAPRVEFPPALTGSGIQTLASSVGVDPGDVDLFAPRGIVNAGDAGIVAGNITIGAIAVVGAGNIQVSGTSVGVPVTTTGVSPTVAGAGNAATAAATSGAASLGSAEQNARREEAPLAKAALGWLDVFVEGFGEEVCKPDDEECLKRNRSR